MIPDVGQHFWALPSLGPMFRDRGAYLVSYEASELAGCLESEAGEGCAGGGVWWSLYTD